MRRRAFRPDAIAPGREHEALITAQPLLHRGKKLPDAYAGLAQESIGAASASVCLPDVPWNGTMTVAYSPGEQMQIVDKCPACGAEVVTKDVEKIVKGGTDTAIIRVQADVCLRCGERLYSADTVRRFEDIRRKLERRDTTGLKRLGTSFQAT